MQTSFWTKLLDLVSPRCCVSCGRRLSAEESVLCPSCRLHLPLTDFVLQPFDNQMARMFWGKMPVEKVASYFFYEPKTVSADVVHALKYHGRDDVAEALGCMVARRFARYDFFSGIDVIVPVPLTRRRLWQRGYNQSLSVARGISSVTGVPIEQALKRTRFAGSQTRLRAEERQSNVEGAFRLRRAEAVRGRHVLLVDDVVTTGATMLACGHELLRAEGVKISILSLGLTR